MPPEPSEFAKQLAAMIRGETPVTAGAFIAKDERRQLGRVGMQALEDKRADVAKAAFGVLIDVEPGEAAHHLMHAHACVLSNEPRDAYAAFSKAMTLAQAPGADRSVAGEAWLGRGELLLRLDCLLDARADLCEAYALITDPARKQSLGSFLAEFDSRRLASADPKAGEM